MIGGNVRCGFVLENSWLKAWFWESISRGHWDVEDGAECDLVLKFQSFSVPCAAEFYLWDKQNRKATPNCLQGCLYLSRDIGFVTKRNHSKRKQNGPVYHAMCQIIVRFFLSSLSLSWGKMVMTMSPWAHSCVGSFLGKELKELFIKALLLVRSEERTYGTGHSLLSL